MEVIKLNKNYHERYTDYNGRLPILNKLATSRDYIYYAEDNLLPQRAVELYLNSPMMQSIINRKAWYTSGAGAAVDNINASNFADRLDGGEGLYELVNKISIDWHLFGGYCLQVIWNKHFNKIDKIIHQDFSSVRVGFSPDRNDDGLYPQGVWISDDWQYNRGNFARKFKPEFYPFYDPAEPNHDTPTFLYVRKYNPQFKWYPLPDWWGSYNSVETEIELINYQKRNVINSFMPSGSIHIPSSLSVEEQEEMQKKVKEELTGTDNAGKVMITSGPPEEQVNWEAFDGNNPADKLIEDSINTARENILIAHGIPSPTIVGLPGGASLGGDGNTIDTASHIFFDNVIKPAQKKIVNQLEKLFDKAMYPTTITIEQVMPQKTKEDNA